MSKSTPHIKNMKIDSSIEKVGESISSTSAILDDIHAVSTTHGNEIADLERRLRPLLAQKGLSLSEVAPLRPNEVPEYETSDEIKNKDYTQHDTVMVCLTGAIAVLVDFLVVKIPKTTNIVRGGEYIRQEGSPLTGWLRAIGFDSNGKTSNWVKTLEGWFRVNYDTSIISGEKGFCPRTHRVYSLGHDPSPSGFLFALHDAITGKMSYISQDGIIKFLSTQKQSPWKLLAMPIIWIGHIVSDIFTKAGIPIPGTCLLRTLQFGSLGEKSRTIGQVVEYMYLEGFDLRHLCTMGVENAVIELILRVYHTLTKPRVERFARPSALIEVEKEMINRRLQKMRLQAYAIASCGNVVKLAVYQWNPLALNLPVWTELLLTSMKEYNRRHGTTQDVIDAIKQREMINNRFEDIEAKLNNI